MAEPQFLRNAPIIEALIDIRVTLPEATKVSVLAEAHEQIKGDYPNVQAQRTLKGQVNFAASDESEGVQQIGDPETTGFFYRSVDQTRLVQFRLDGFSFNQLKPYPTWEEVFPEALRLWKVYRDFCPPQTVTRLALRYINQIAIPTPFTSFEDFLMVPPRVPPNTPTDIAGFLVQTTGRHDSDTFTTITQTLSPESSEEYAVVLLDIDVFKVFEDLKPENEEVITETFNNLRHIKNITFFSSVTERAVELFQ